MQSSESFVSLSDIKMGCGASREGRRKRVVVFGATGRQGGSVLRALAKDRSFLPVGVARDAFSVRALELKKEGHAVVEGDLEDTESLMELLKGAYGCFIVTSYWDHFDIIRDSQQGKNAVDCAVACGVHHILFSGQESPKAVIDKCCDPFDSKRRVEEYLKKKKPAYPMGDVPLHGIAVEDIGKCVHKIFKKAEVFRRKIVPLSGDQLTVQEYVQALNKHMAPKVFCDPQITLDDYSHFSFKGAKEISAMFAFYKFGRPFRDVRGTRKLHKGTLSFDDWVAKNKTQLDELTTSRVQEPIYCT